METRYMTDGWRRHVIAIRGEGAKALSGIW